MSTAEDPGWGFALRSVIPLVGIVRFGARHAPDGLTAIRSIFVGLVGALPLFAVSLSYVVEPFGGTGFAPFVVMMIGVISTLALGFLFRRPLATTSLASLVITWRSRFFIGIGFAETPALVGLALTFATDVLWIYLIGMAFSLIGLWRLAPLRRNLARDQEVLRSAGSPLDLTEALMRGGPTSKPGSPSRPDG